MSQDFIITSKNNHLKYSNDFDEIKLKKILIFLKKEKYKNFQKGNKKYFIIGNINGYYDKDLVLNKFTQKLLPKFVESNLVSKLDGRFVIIQIENEKIQIFCDYFSRYEIYYKVNGSNILISNNLKTFFNDTKNTEIIDTVSFSHSLSIYGNRPFKGDTILKKVKRLMLNQNIKINNNKFTIINKKFIAESINKNFNIKDTQEYSKAFLKTLKIKSSKKLNIIFMSSGWDSSSILAGLVKIHGAKKIQCVIGRMKFSKNLIANGFEISRAKKICNFFGVKLHITDFNYYKNNVLRDQNLISFLKDNQLASITSINHFVLSKFVKKKFGSKCNVFCGEISDGAHNLGFSQYTSIFHPSSYDFREYSDKMNSYLFGPTFLNFAHKNSNLEKDPIFSIFKKNNPYLKFDKLGKSKKSINESFLSSFFLRPTRLPFVSKENLKFLTKKGKSLYQNKMTDKISKIIKIDFNIKNHYSKILYLYNFFHWQGSTVLSFEKTCDYFGHVGHLPFLDQKIFKILSQMPEKYGRGLDFNNTKFLLKNMLKTNIKYPMHLQEGPHSYLYDVNPSFNHNYEIIYNSSMKKTFEEKLKKGTFISYLDKKYFDKKYIGKLRKNYLNGKKTSGQELVDLFALSVHELVYAKI